MLTKNVTLQEKKLAATIPAVPAVEASEGVEARAATPERKLYHLIFSIDKPDSNSAAAGKVDLTYQSQEDADKYKVGNSYELTLSVELA